MRYASTTCCADKRRDAALIPARERYLDPRIRRVEERAAVLGLPLLILSGRLGLVAAGEPIPWYDEALTRERVPALVPLLVDQLHRRGATGLVFFALPRETPGWRPYHHALELACRRSGVELELQPPPPAGAS